MKMNQNEWQLSVTPVALIVCPMKMNQNEWQLSVTPVAFQKICAPEDLAKDSTKIIVRLETRRFRKKGTMIEGLDPKLNNLEGVAKELKNKYACGGTAKDGYIFLQGDHRDTISETLINLGFSESSIELH